MTLFPTENILPRDGISHYHGIILSEDLYKHFQEALLKNIHWQHDEVFIFGKHITTARKVAWHGDSDFAYQYSQITRRASPWGEELSELKDLIEKTTGSTYNSCLLNLYHHGNEGMGWHSDDEKTIVKHSSIASLSLGAQRPFRLRHKTTGETIPLNLENGSLLDMKGSTQEHWKHCLPKTTKVTELRINLTFRKMIKP